MEDRNRDEDRVLDAAHATVLDFGVRRATLTEVARRAGLSRMTVYRRYSDAPELMRALMSREFGEVLLQAEAQTRELADPLDRIVGAVVGTAAMLMEHPLLLRLLELEPEVLMPYLSQRVGVFQQTGRAAMAGWIVEAQRTGAIRAGDPEVMAATIELIGRGPVIAARTLTGDRAAVLDELRLAIRSYLRP